MGLMCGRAKGTQYNELKIWDLSLQKTHFKIGFNLFCSPKKLSEYKATQPRHKRIWRKTRPFNLSLQLHDLFSLQDPNADTEWNDILRKKGILPPKEEPKEDEEEELALKQQSVGKTAVYRDYVLPKCWLCFMYLLVKFEKLSILLLLFNATVSPSNSQNVRGHDAGGTGGERRWVWRGGWGCYWNVQVSGY